VVNFLKRNLGLLGVLLLTLINFFVWYAVFAEDREVELTIAFLNVGQGDAIFIDSPMGNQVLIDGGGPDGKVLRSLSRVMPFYDRSIDMVIATHPDQDHIGGLAEVFKRFDVLAYMDPAIPNDTGAFVALQSAVEAENIEHKVVARRGMKIILSKSAYLEVLFPDRDVSGVSNTNDGSIVAKLVYGNTEVMLTGDSPEKIEKYLASIDGLHLKSDILKLGHHGSKTSSSGEFLSVVDPELAIISAGKDNRYGHPHQEVLDRLEGLKIKSLRTFEEGTIVFVTDGQVIQRK